MYALWALGLVEREALANVALTIMITNKDIAGALWSVLVVIVGLVGVLWLLFSKLA